MAVKEPDNFKTLYAPGFNRIFESGTGFGFNYTISYSLLLSYAILYFTLLYYTILKTAIFY